MRRRRSGRAIAKAVSIDTDLYQKAMEERVAARKIKFSRYVRELIREDLRKCGMLEFK